MKRIPALILLTILLGSAALFVTATAWTSVNDGYSVKFSGGKTEGTFSGLTSTVVIDDAHPEKSKITASIVASSISTGNGTKDSHAMEAEALNTEKYPMITFESTAVSKSEKGYVAVGTLTLRGVAKEITIPFTFTEKGAEAKLTGEFTVTPKEFGLTRGGTPETVKIELSVPFNKAK